jgi:adenosylcobinamide-phosphate synthase
MSASAFVLVLALLIDRFVGDPDWLWRKLPHPVVWFGKAISFIDTAFNRPHESAYLQRRNGFLAMLALLVACALAGALVHLCLARFHFTGLLIEAIIASVFLAQKSLSDHVQKVAEGLREGGLAQGREAVSMIVGRDTAELDEAGVCRAAIETLAENSSDGVVAPAFWYLIGGLPGLFAYKMLNTADSMIGHLSPKYKDFGRFAAKLDDVANWIPARLSGLLIALSCLVTEGLQMAKRSWTIMLRDARLHGSPNAGWPEAAMAGALGLMLGGPRKYGAESVNAPVLNGSGRGNATLNDIHRSLTIFWGAMTILTLLAGISVFL